MYYYTLTDEGQRHVIDLIKAHCTQGVIDYLPKGQYSWFQQVEFSANESGSHLELSSRYTDIGHPVVLDIPAAWFTTEVVD